MSDLRALLGDAALRLAVAGIDSPRLDARLLLAHAMNVPPDTLLGSVEVPSDARVRFETSLARRILREPLAYITGKKEFWSLEFNVGPGALIPRPETETLVEQVLEYFPERSRALEIVDLGTGTGCLLAACLREYPNARGLGIDASQTALAWARRNIDKLGLRGRCELELADWRKILGAKADVIVSNPPYIRSQDILLLASDVRLFEPLAALDGGEDGLDANRALAPIIRRVLKPKGALFLEIGAGQGEAVSAILGAQGLETVRIATDLAGIGRCVIARRKARNPAQHEKTVGTTAQNR